MVGCCRRSSTTSSGIGASTPTVEAALQWAPAPQGVQPFRWKQQLSVVRGFVRYLHGLDPAVPVPPSDLLIYRRRRPTPYVMSDADITGLVSAATQRPRPLTAATYHMLVGLMAVTGMRVGEAVGLDVDDGGRCAPRASTTFPPW
jgi:integrase/recombinase XerD